MAVTQNTYTGNGSTTNYSFTFPYMSLADIKVKLNGVTQATTEYTFPNATTVSMDTAPSNGVTILIFRDTNNDNKQATFYPGSAIKAEDLNNNYDQILYTAQEVDNYALGTLGDDEMLADFKMGSNNIIFEGATADAHETTLTVTDPTADRTITLPNVTGTVVTTGDTATVTETMLADNSVGTNELKANSVTTAKIDNLQVTNAKIGADAVTGAKIADNAVDSEHYIDGSIDTIHIADNAITMAKLNSGALPTDITVNIDNLTANSVDSSELVDGSVDLSHMSANSVDSNQYVDGSIDTAHISDNAITVDKISNAQVTEVKLASNSVTQTKIADNAVTVDKIVDNAITNAKIAATTIQAGSIASAAITNNKIAADAVRTAQIQDANITTAKIAADAIDSTKIADDSINSEHYVDGSIDTQHISDANITTAKIADDAVTAAKIADAAIVTNSEQAASTPDDVTFFTTSAADARYFNVSTGDTIKDGQTFPDNDTTIATTAAINDRIIDLVDDVGGFVPIANETSFPNANPDVNNGTGTLVSIKTLSTDYTSNGSGVITILNGTVGSSDVTINGAENSTTYSSGYGMIVETTTTLNTYTFHRLVPKATEVTTVAGKATEIGRLGTAAAVEDLGILGTTAIVEDMNLLGTTACVADMALLGDSAVIADMATIADTSNLISNIGTVAGIQANVTTVAGNNSNVTTVAGNISDVNNFADLYQIASSSPSTDGGGNSLAVGDLYFDSSSSELKVYNGSAWQGGVTASGNFALLSGSTFTGDMTFNGDNYHMMWDKSANSLEFWDNAKLTFGDPGGTPDLQIYHDGTDSYIKDLGTGHLILNTSRLEVKNPASNEVILKGYENGAVELYYDNSKKLETTSAGVTVTGEVSLNGNLLMNHADNHKILLGAGDDLQIYHDGSNAYIRDTTGTNQTLIDGAGGIDFRHYSTGENMIRAIGNNRVELLYDNVKKFETTANGITVSGNYIGTDWIKLQTDNKGLYSGASDDFGFFHDGTNSVITNLTGGLYIKGTGGSGNAIYLQPKNNENSAIFNPDGAAELYYNNNQRFLTETDGVTIKGNEGGEARLYFYADEGDDNADKIHFAQDTSGNLRIRHYDGSNWNTRWKFNSDGDLEAGDSIELRFGAGDDLKIYHDGSHSYIVDSGTGDLRILSNELNIQNAAGTETQAYFAQDGAVALYYDGTKKLDTYSSGVTIYGHCALNDNGHVALGDGSDLQIYHDGSTSRIKHDGTGDLSIQSNKLWLGNSGLTETYAELTQNAAVELKYDNVKKFETTSTGATITGTLISDGLDLGDNEYLRLGTGNDLLMGHTGTDSFLRNDVGEFYLRSNGIRIVNQGNDETYIKCIDDAAVELYYDNSKKAQTASWGFQVYGNLQLDDGNQLNIGNSSDLILMHDGSNSYISSGGVGSLYIRTSTSDNAVKCVKDGSVELYYDATKKFNTSSTGAEFHGEKIKQTGTGETSLQIGSTNAGGAAIYLDGDSDGDFAGGDYSWIRHTTGGDMEICADNPDSDAALYVKTGSGATNSIYCQGGGKVELMHNGSSKFETTSSGVKVSSASADATLEVRSTNQDGAGVLNLIADNGDDSSDYFRIKADGGGNSLYMQNFASGSWENNFAAHGNGATQLHYDNALKLQTYADGVEIIGDLWIDNNTNAGKDIWWDESADTLLFYDDVYAKFGSSGDLAIYHDASNSYISNTTGNLYIDGHADDLVLQATDDIRIQTSGNENAINCVGDGAVELYYNAVKKLETTSSGVDVTGYFNVTNSGLTAQIYHSGTGDTIGCVMRHGRGGLSGYAGKMIGFYGNDNTEEGSIVIGTSATAYNTSSDYRLKENEVAISDGITRLKRLKPYRFNFKKDTDTTVDGFFAHEVTPAVPEAINGTKDATNSDGSIKPQQIDQSKLVPLLTAALQEAITKIETLETKVAALESS